MLINVDSDLKSGERTLIYLKPFRVLTVLVGLVVMGLFSISTSTLRFYPSDKTNSILISFSWPGASPNLVEYKVTSQLEATLTSIRGISGVTSKSRNGNGSISVTLDDNADRKMIRYEISTIISRLYKTLPEGVSYPEIIEGDKLEDNSSNILTYSILDQNLNSNCEQLIEGKFKPALRSVYGVNDVLISGSKSYFWKLTYTKEKLIQYNVSVAEILSAVKHHYQKYDLGIIQFSTKGILSTTQTVLSLETASSNRLDFDRILIKSNGGRNIFLNDVVKIAYEIRKPKSYYRLNGLPTINLDINCSKNVCRLPFFSTI